MQMEIDLENENQLKRIRKPPLLLTQEESLTEKVKKYPSLLDKSQKRTKKETLFKNVPYPKPSPFFHVLATFVSKFKNKNNIMSNSSPSILISAK